MKRYADDYEIEVVEQEDGREKKIAVYQGKYYEISTDTQDIVAFRRYSLILLFVILVLHIVSGFVANRGMYQFYIALPYAISFMPIYYLASGALRLPREKRKYRRDEIGLSFDRLKRACVALLITLGIGAVGELVYLIWFASHSLDLEIVYLILLLLELLAGYIFFRLRQRIPIQECIEG
jgi:hypothetical protein